MSSDSSEEDVSAFREAADTTLFTDDLYNAEKKKDEENPLVIKKPVKPSLRPHLEDDKQHNHMRVTPEFQNYCARQLSKLLDSQIKEEQGAAVKSKRESSSESGVRLLGSSQGFLSCECAEAAFGRQRRQEVGVRDDSGLSQKQKCHEAAVSAEWVLDGVGVAGWQPNRRGKVVVLPADQVEIVKGQSRQESDCGKKNGISKANHPQPLTKEEKAERKRQKKVRRWERLKMQKMEQEKQVDDSVASGNSSVGSHITKVKKKKKKNSSFTES